MKSITKIFFLSTILVACTPSVLMPTLTPLSMSTLTPIPADTKVPLPTALTIPTLPIEDARLKLLGLLTNNGNCRLPCLWGITPGESASRDAETILVPLSALSNYTGFGIDYGSLSPEFAESDLRIRARIFFSADSNSKIVDHISFTALAEKKVEFSYQGGVTYKLQPIFDSAIFGERLNYYMLSSILTKYGQPESVRISTAARLSLRESPGGGFEIILLYPDEGLFVKYATQMQVVGTNVRGCPSNAHVEFGLYPSGQRDTFFHDLDINFWPRHAPNRFRPLDEVTFMSLDEFFQTFRQPTNECIGTPASLWPVPD